MAIEYRWAERRFGRLPVLAADLVVRKVDVIAANDIPSARAAKSATSSIPIIFIIGGDPVAAGLVAGLARPGGNLTGISFISTALMPKRLELLSELVPRAKVIALLVNPNSPNTDLMMRNMPAAARAEGLQLHILKATAEPEIDAAFATLVNLQAGALVVGTDAFFYSERDQLVALAARHAVPAIYDAREFVAGGGLISYGPSSDRHIPPSRHLRRKDPQGRKALRSADPAAGPILAGDQSQDRKGARPYGVANVVGAGRRGHRIGGRNAPAHQDRCARRPERRSRRQHSLHPRHHHRVGVACSGTRSMSVREKSSPCRLLARA